MKDTRECRVYRTWVHPVGEASLEVIFAATSSHAVMVTSAVAVASTLTDVLCFFVLRGPFWGGPYMKDTATWSLYQGPSLFKAPTQYDREGRMFSNAFTPWCNVILCIYTSLSLSIYLQIYIYSVLRSKSTMVLHFPKPKTRNPRLAAQGHPVIHDSAQCDCCI